jgi:hypothetical protein
MRRWFALLTLLLSLCIPARVQAQRPVHASNAVQALAQSAISIQDLQIDVWPEYDQPGVLVIYRITLAPTVKLPTEMTMRVPVSSGGPSAVAEQTANGLFNLEISETGRDNQWVTIHFTTTLPQLQLEYYDTALKADGAQHTFTYRWPGDYPVASLLVKVQQPRTASQLSLEPNMGTSSTGQDGLTYFDVPLGKVDAGQSFQLQVRYQKSDSELTQNAAFTQVTPVPPANSSATSRAFPQLLPWLLGLLGVVLIGGGVYWYLRSARPPSSPARTRHRGEMVEPASGEVLFCHQCGKKAGSADIFCRVCGAKLRR